MASSVHGVALQRRHASAIPASSRREEALDHVANSFIPSALQDCSERETSATKRARRSASRSQVPGACLVTVCRLRLSRQHDPGKDDRDAEGHRQVEVLGPPEPGQRPAKRNGTVPIAISTQPAAR